MRHKYLIYCVFFVFLVAAQPVSAEIRLTFGVYTSDKPTSMVKKFRPVLNAVEAELERVTKEKVEIKLHIARDYESGIEDIVSGRVDFTRLGPASYIQAKEMNPAISLLAMETHNGNKRFNGVICVKDDSSVKTISDLKGKKFAFGNQRSTIGRYLSQAYLVKHRIFAKDLESFEYLDRHDKVGYAVAYGHYDAGALKESTFKKLVKKGRPLRMLAVFENVTKPWVARSGLPEKLKSLLKKSLLSLENSGKNGFATAMDNDYKVIRQAISSNNEFFKH